MTRRNLARVAAIAMATFGLAITVAPASADVLPCGFSQSTTMPRGLDVVPRGLVVPRGGLVVPHGYDVLPRGLSALPHG